jgi:hypothetical protein
MKGRQTASIKVRNERDERPSAFGCGSRLTTVWADEQAAWPSVFSTLMRRLHPAIGFKFISNVFILRVRVQAPCKSGGGGGRAR